MKNAKYEVTIQVKASAVAVSATIADFFWSGDFSRLISRLKTDADLKALVKEYPDDTDLLREYAEADGIAAWAKDVLPTLKSDYEPDCIDVDTSSLQSYSADAVIKWFRAYGAPWLKAEHARLKGKLAENEAAIQKRKQQETLALVAKLRKEGWVITAPKTEPQAVKTTQPHRKPSKLGKGTPRRGLAGGR